MAISADQSAGLTTRQLFSDLFFTFCIVSLIIVFRNYADRILLTSWVLVVGYYYRSRRKGALIHQFLATLTAVIWVSFAKEYYGYKYDYLTIFGMNTLPLMAWTLALLELCEFSNYFKLRRKIFNFLIFIGAFWVSLILFETVAYHVLEMRNTMTGNFVGLPYCDCIHAPTWMKVAYFSMGPVYYALTLLADHLIGRMRE